MSLNKNSDLELMSEESYEMMGAVPPWIIQWGTTIIFLSCIIILVFSFLIKYPDQITSKVIISSENPPYEVLSKVNGRIQYLFIKDGESVKENQLLAVIENTANFNHINQLELKIDSIADFLLKNKISLPEIPKSYVLGTIQSNYTNFYTQYQEFKNYLSLNPTESKIASLNAQIQGYNLEIKNQEIQLSNSKRMLFLSNKKFIRDSILFHQKVLTAAEFDVSEQTYILEKNKIAQLKSNIDRIKAEKARVQFDIVNIKELNLEKGNQYLISINSSLKTLQTAIAEWKSLYLLYSPIDGKVAFISYWSTNQNVTLGKAVFTIVPSNYSKIVGRVKLSSLGYGKVEIGQKVNIQLDNFPYKEYGLVTAVVEDIAIIPEEDNSNYYYTVKVSFPDSLTTSYKMVLPFSQNMQGSAEIITKNLSIFDRITQNFRSKVNKTYN